LFDLLAAATCGLRIRPTNGIQKTPYQLWIQQAINASYNVVHAPLTASAAKLFNNSAAMNYFTTVEGFDYGYHTLLWCVCPCVVVGAVNDVNGGDARRVSCAGRWCRVVCRAGDGSTR
jgi:hypothetical protein